MVTANSFHFITYLSFATGWASAYRSLASPLDFVSPHRHLVWLASTGTMVCVLGDLAPASDTKARVFAPTFWTDIAMSAFVCGGALTAVLTRACQSPWACWSTRCPTRFGRFCLRFQGLALCTTVLVSLAARNDCLTPHVAVCGQIKLLQLAAAAVSEEDATPLNAMRHSILATWAPYPVLRMAVIMGFVGVSTQECTYCMFDFLTKSAWEHNRDPNLATHASIPVGYTTILLVGAFEQADSLGRVSTPTELQE